MRDSAVFIGLGVGIGIWIGEEHESTRPGWQEAKRYLPVVCDSRPIVARLVCYTSNAAEIGLTLMRTGNQVVLEPRYVSQACIPTWACRYVYQACVPGVYTRYVY